MKRLLLALGMAWYGFRRTLELYDQEISFFTPHTSHIKRGGGRSRPRDI